MAVVTVLDKVVLHVYKYGPEFVYLLKLLVIVLLSTVRIKLDQDCHLYNLAKTNFKGNIIGKISICSFKSGNYLKYLYVKHNYDIWLLNKKLNSLEMWSDLFMLVMLQHLHFVGCVDCKASKTVSAWGVWHASPFTWPFSPYKWGWSIFNFVTFRVI